MKKFFLEFTEFTQQENTSLKALLISLFFILGSYFLGKLVFTYFLKNLIKNTKNQLDDLILEFKLDSLISFIFPGIVFYLFVCPIYQGTVQDFFRRTSFAYIVLLSSLAISKSLTILVLLSQKIEKLKDKPIKSYVQTVKIFLFLVTFVLLGSVLLHRSPASFLGGIGALTAILLLVFKDSILGFVASVQIATNNLISLGDWIEVPKYSADGEVIDISLSTIKVQNWDKTITSLPTYGLISDSFKNWRGMSESGGRRIKRSIKLDMTSIKFCDQTLLEKLQKIKLLNNFLQIKNKEITEHNQKNLINPRKLTNIGIFRFYLQEYLKQNRLINQKMTFIIRHLAPSRDGLPVEIYVFSKNKDWADYEGVQADIFDHILAVIPEFELRIFQDPSSYDLQNIKSNLVS